MKKLNVMYNHNIFDEPYKQSEVRKTEGKIKALLGDDVQVIVTHTSFSAPNSFFPDSDLIIAEHTFTMASEEKRALATILNESVTRLKKCEPTDVVVSFRKIEEDDLYLFEV